MNQLIEKLKQLVASLQAYLSNKTMPTIPVPPPAPSPFLFDTYDHAVASCRQIAIQEALSLDQIAVFLACIQVESAFKSNAVHINRDEMGRIESTDYGICQVNDYWHIGFKKDFPSVSYVMTHPEASVRWMARMFKAGKADMWISYKQNMYQKYLPLFQKVATNT